MNTAKGYRIVKRRISTGALVWALVSPQGAVLAYIRIKSTAEAFTNE